MAERNGDVPHKREELERLREKLAQKSSERERVLGLYRRGRIDDATLDQQLDVIGVEAGALEAEIEARNQALAATDDAEQLSAAEELLAALRKRLDGQVSHEMKRRIIETLVDSIQANTVETWGVQQSELVITYRFSQPTNSAPLVVPRFHRILERNQAPEELNTLGDHLLRRRLTLKLQQGQVAQQLGTCKTCVANWEKGRSEPAYEHMPTVIRFLGYNPLPPAEGWAARLVQGRTLLGLSQKAAARQIGVDPGTLARWERGERKPSADHARRAERFLAGVESHAALSARLA